MSAIAGMVHWNRESIDTRPLFEMSRAMLLRGGAHRNAELRGGVALVQHRASPSSARMPLSVAPHTLLLDGSPSLCPSDEALFEPFFEPSLPEELLRAYTVLGSGLADALRGAYALALADEERAELLLARDADGAKPLFYREEDGTLYFASEIKALVRTIPSSARIDTEALRTHLLSPCGVLFGEDLYRDVTALPAGHTAILSRLGLRIFPNTPPSAPSETPQSPDVSYTELFLPDEESLSKMLGEILYVFDYPQFDYLMPSLLQTLSAVSGTPQPRTVEDPTLYMNLRYAHERADRLGSLRGASLIPVPPRRFFAKERELRRLEKPLRSLLGSVDTAPLRHLFGEHWSATLTKEKNTARRIRMEGMAYQTILWLTQFPLMLS